MHLSFNQKLNVDTNLLVQHIITTFNACVGVIWLAANDAFYAKFPKGAFTIPDRNSLVCFLSGYYYGFLKQHNNISPILIENLKQLSGLPDSVHKFARVENISTLLISPVMFQDQVRGILLLGTPDKRNFTDLDFELLRLLTETALSINEQSLIKQPGSSIRSPALNMYVRSVFGKSLKMRDLDETIARIADTKSNVIIYGENGTGKGHIARIIHEQSKRKEQPFIPIDCALFPDEHLESELFGFEKNADNGVNHVKRGLLEYANQGTCFLEAFTGIGKDLQSKLLLALKQGKIRRLNGRKWLDVDIRIIASSTRPAVAKNGEQQLSNELFGHHNTVSIYVPPLRERREDIPQLTLHFIEQVSAGRRDGNVQVTDGAMFYLCNYSWPGNVSELKLLIEHLASQVKTPFLSEENLPKKIIRNPVTNGKSAGYFGEILPYSRAKHNSLIEFERQYFSRLIDKWSGNITKVADEARVSRKTVYNILAKHGMSRVELAEKTFANSSFGRYVKKVKSFEK